MKKVYCNAYVGGFAVRILSGIDGVRRRAVCA